MTFLNQIETHTGKPAVLKLGRQFEKTYPIAATLDRALWLSVIGWSRIGGRPWALWTANSALQTSAAEQPLRWVVVQR
jgi:lysozyme